MCKSDGVHRSPIPTLPSSPRVVEYGVITIWGLLGHATWCCGSLSKLVRQVEQTQKVLWSMILSWNWFLSWNFSCYWPCLTGQMLLVFLHLTLCLICLVFVLSMLFDLFFFFYFIFLFFFCLLAHCLCALLFSVFSFSIFQWSLLIIKKKSTEKYNDKLLSITPQRRLSQTNLKQNFIVSENLETYSSSLLLNRKLHPYK